MEYQFHELPYLVTQRILSFMDFVDLCRLRLTCKAFRDLSTRFLHPLAAMKMEIGDKSRMTFLLALEFAQNLELDIEVLTIKTTTDTIYESAGMGDFLSICGRWIKKLKLQNYFLESPSQLYFLQNLPNVRELKIELIDGLGMAKYPRFSTSDGGEAFTLELAGFFQHLKLLKFGTIKIYKSISSGDFWYQMIRGCPRLNYIRFPTILYDEHPSHGAGSVGGYNFKLAAELIKRQRASSPSSDWLTTIDFKNLDFPTEFDEEYRFFAHLLDKINGLGLRFINVKSAYMKNFIGAPEALDCVSSIMGFHPNLANYQLDRLERITILLGDMNYWEEPRWEWENLKSIRIHYDLKTAGTRPKPNNTNILAMHEFLITAPARAETLEELQLIFDEGARAFQISQGLVSSAGICFGVGTSLRKLTLLNWNPVNSAFPTLWNGLPLLEELHLENCPSLGNVGFIGTDLSLPAFLKLTRLVKLTLILDEMKKVSGRAFRDVFSHVRLRELNLKSVNPLENIGKESILALLDGEFARTIERFPFTGWSLLGVSGQEMLGMKSQFQSLIS